MPSTTPSSSIVGTKRIRKVLKIIAQCSLPATPTAATFVSIPFPPLHKSIGLADILFDGCEKFDSGEVTQPQELLLAPEKNWFHSTTSHVVLLYVAQQGGGITVC